MSNILIAPAWGIKKTPRFNTLLQETAALQGSVAVSLANYPVWDFKCDLPYISGRIDDPTSPIAALLGFIFKTKGKAGTFLFRDPRDNTVTSFQFATGDGSSKVFQLTRPIGNSGAVDIVQNLDGSPSIYLNSTLQTSGYTIDSNGIVTFTTAPGNGVAIKWTGNFLFLCRMTEDTLADLKLFFEGKWSVATFDFVSVLK